MEMPIFEEWTLGGVDQNCLKILDHMVWLHPDLDLIVLQKTLFSDFGVSTSRECISLRLMSCPPWERCSVCRRARGHNFDKHANFLALKLGEILWLYSDDPTEFPSKFQKYFGG